MADLCALADVRAYLNLPTTDTSGDPVISSLVTNMSAWLESQVGRPLSQQTYTNEPHSGDGNYSLLLNNGPVVSVSSLTIDGNTVNQRDQNTEGWVVQGDRLWLSGPAGSTGFISGPFWVATSPTRMTYLRFTIGNANIAVTYTAGFAVIPGDIKQAVIELAAETYQRRMRLGLLGRTDPQGGSTSFAPLAVTPTVQAVIDNYRPRRV